MQDVAPLSPKSRLKRRLDAVKQRKSAVEEPVSDAGAIKDGEARGTLSSLDSVKARIAQVRQRASLPPYAIDEVCFI